jgi:uncharacterized membrane protein YeiH
MSSNDILFQVATAIFAITGVLAAAKQNMDAMSFIIIGVVTAIGGGIIRDVLTGQPTLLSRRELYMTPILIGLIPFVGALDSAHSNSATLAPLAMLAIASLRIGAIRRGWSFPDWLTYKPLK